MLVKLQKKTSKRGDCAIATVIQLHEVIASPHIRYTETIIASAIRFVGTSELLRLIKPSSISNSAMIVGAQRLIVESYLLPTVKMLFPRFPIF